jgi:hypothetical protein
MNKRPSGDAAKHRARCRLRIKRPLQLGFGFALSLVGCQNPPLFACFRQHDRVAFGSVCRATATEAPGPRSFALRKPAALARQQSREGVSSFALKNQFFVARPSKRQAARSLRRYLRARSRAACLPHALTRHKSSSPGVASIDRPKTEWHKLSASKAIPPGRHHLGTPGDIMSERWARSSRNAGRLHRNPQAYARVFRFPHLRRQRTARSTALTRNVRPSPIVNPRYPWK